MLEAQKNIIVKIVKDKRKELEIVDDFTKKIYDEILKNDILIIHYEYILDAIKRKIELTGGHKNF